MDNFYRLNYSQKLQRIYRGFPKLAVGCFVTGRACVAATKKTFCPLFMWSCILNIIITDDADVTTCVHADVIIWRQNHKIMISSTVSVSLFTRCWLWCSFVVCQLKRGQRRTDITIFMLFKGLALDRTLLK